MRCTTCGEDVKEHEAACSTCGAVLAVRAPMQRISIDIRSCPRCGHLGTGVKFFQRPGHVALLLGLSAASWFTFGIGGLIYYAARRKRRVCGECGLGWERARSPEPGFSSHPAFAGSAGVDPGVRGVVFDSESSLPRRGVVRRVLGVGMVLFAALLVTIGVVEFAVEAIAIGSMFGIAGTTSIWWGLRAREDRRLALMTRLQRKVLLLATEKSGTLTVTEVAASLNMSLSAAEEVLDRMDDGLRVRSEVTNQGIIVYEFPELRHRPQLEPGSAG